MKSKKLQQWLLLSATTGLLASQTLAALPHQNLNPAPDQDLLALSKEDEAFIQGLFDQFDLNSNERAQLLQLIDPTIPGIIEDFDLSRDPEAPMPMEEHPKYIALMEQISTLPRTPVTSCPVVLSSHHYYYLEHDISCTLATSSDVGIVVGNNAILNLGGNQVTGNGIGTGIQLGEKTTLFGGVRRGSVSGFETGVFSDKNDNLVLHVESSNNTSSNTGYGYGINFSQVFTSNGPHEFKNHDVMYSVANNNTLGGIVFLPTDQTGASGNVVFSDNHVYSSKANNNGGGINLNILFPYGIYSHIDIHNNSVSHSKTDNNNETGIQILGSGFNTSNGFTIKENHISHSTVHCKSDTPCHSAGGIVFLLNGGNDTSNTEVNVTDNSIEANSVYNSAGTGIFFEMSSLVEFGSGNINMSRNQVQFNHVSHNQAGITFIAAGLVELVNGNIDTNDNLVAFNRVAYSQQIGIFFSFINIGACGIVNSNDNLALANSVHETSTGIFLQPISTGSCINSTNNTWTMNNNSILFNQTTSNQLTGLQLLGFISVSGTNAEERQNRVSFNRSVNNQSDGISYFAEAATDATHTPKAIDNQVDHNILLNNQGNGVDFIVLSLGGSSGFGTSYENRVRKNFIKENQESGITASSLASNGYHKQGSEKNGIFQNLVIENGYGINIVNGSDNLVRQNHVTKSVNDGITVRDVGDTISKNISIANGGFNFVDSAGLNNPLHCNDWDNNFAYITPFTGEVKINPEICFDIKL